MRRVLARAGGVALFVFLAALPIASQVPALRIISATPTGELTTLADADQIRILFSEPMVAVGTVPSGTKPEWITMTPALAGSFYWSGTKTLMFSPNIRAPVPYATHVTVRVAPDATEPPWPRARCAVRVHVHDADGAADQHEWYAATTRFDRPALIALRFNQPVRPADVLAHVRCGRRRTRGTCLSLSPLARTRLEQTDPRGIAALRREGRGCAPGRVSRRTRHRRARDGLG